MSLTASATVSVPFVQKGFDLKSTGHRIAGFFQRKAHSGRPKVEQHAAKGTLIAKAKTSKFALNLKSMHLAANPQSKVPANAAPSAQGTAGNAAAGGSAVAGGALQPTSVGASAANNQPIAATPDPIPGERLTTLRAGVKSVMDGMPDLAKLHARTRKDGFDIRAGKGEERYLDRRDNIQAKIGKLLTEADAAIAAASASDPQTLADLKAARRSLVALSLAAEFPQVVAGARTAFEQILPASAKTVMFGRMGEMTGLDAAARDFLASYDDPGRIPPAQRDPSVPKRLEALIDELSTAGLAGDELGTLSYLRDLKCAVDLRTDLDAAVDTFSALRERKPPVPLDKLCREISHLPGMHIMTGSAKLRDQQGAMEVVSKLAGQLAQNVVPDMLVPRDADIRKLVTDIRVIDCQDKAALTFAGSLDDAAFATPKNAADYRKALATLLETAKAENRRVSGSEISALLPDTTKADLQTALDKGEAAAKTRELYFDQLGRVERIVGKDTAFAYKGSVWMKLGLPESALTYRENSPRAQSTKDAQARGATIDMTEVQRAGSALKKLAKQNPEAAFLVAGLAFLEHQVAKADKEVLGLTHYDNIEIADFDSQRVLDYAGVTVKRMEKLGYSAADAESFPERMHSLGKAGLRTPGQVDTLRNVLTHTARETFSNVSIQNMVSDFAAGSVGAQAKHALTSMLTDAGASALGVATPKDGDPSLNAASKTVVDGFNKMSLAITKAVVNNDELTDNLISTGATFAAADKEILDLVGKRVDLATEVTKKREALTVATGKDGPLGGLDLDPRKPAGLKSAKAVLEALRWDAEVQVLTDIRAPQGVIDDVLAARNEALEKLRGFDAESMRRPWHGKLANFFGKAERPDIAQLRAVKEVAENIIFLREGAPAARNEIDEDIGLMAQVRQDLSVLRMAESPSVMLTAQQMIRAAVLANWPADNVYSIANDGRVVDAYEPAFHRDKIETTLKSWGLDTEAFGPEISIACNGTLGKHDLANWAAETRTTDRATDLVPEPVQRSRGERFLRSIQNAAKETFTLASGRDALLYLAANKKVMDAQFKNEIYSIHQSLKDGDKFDFKTGYKISLNSGKIPVDPTATAGVRAKLAVAGMSNIVMERSSDGWKVTARGGAQASLGVEVIADQRLEPTGAAAVGVSLGGEVQGTFLLGHTVTFPNDEKGRAACAALIINLANGEKPTAELFEAASDSGSNREVGGKIGASLKAYVRAEATAQPFGTDGDIFGERVGPTDKSAAANKLGIGATASAEYGGSLGMKWKAIRSLNKITHETEREISTGFNLNLNVYAKVVTLPGMVIGEIMKNAGAQDAADARFHTEKSGQTSGTYDVGSSTANEQLLNVDLGLALQRVRKTKAEFTQPNRPGDTQQLTKAEIVQRSNCTIGTEVALIGIGTKALAKLLETKPDFRANYMALKADVGIDDALQITYAMNAAKLGRFNELMRQADEHAAGGSPVRAAQVRGRATAMLDDIDNFEPSKITVLKKVTQRDAANRGNALLARFDITAEASWEESESILRIDMKTIT